MQDDQDLWLLTKQLDFDHDKYQSKTKLMMWCITLVSPILNLRKNTEAFKGSPVYEVNLLD